MLNGGTVPPDKRHPGGTVPPDKTHPGGTVTSDKTHPGGTVPPYKTHLGGTVQILFGSHKNVKFNKNIGVKTKLRLKI